MALKDYLIAKPFPVPIKSTFFEDGSEKTMPVIHNSEIDMIGINNIFKEAINNIESDFPAQHEISVPSEFLYVLTPLLGNDNREIYPVAIRNGNVIRLD